MYVSTYDDGTESGSGKGSEVRLRLKDDYEMGRFGV